MLKDGKKFCALDRLIGRYFDVKLALMTTDGLLYQSKRKARFLRKSLIVLFDSNLFQNL